MNATIQLTHIGTDNTATVLGNRNELITLLHQAFLEVPTFKSVCTEALLTFDTEAAAAMPSLFEQEPLSDKVNIPVSYNVFDQFNIPQKYKYFVVNRWGMGFAFAEKPLQMQDGWVSINGNDIDAGGKNSEGMHVADGFSAICWDSQMIRRAMNGKPSVKIKIRNLQNNPTQ